MAALRVQAASPRPVALEVRCVLAVLLQQAAVTVRCVPEVSPRLAAE